MSKLPNHLFCSESYGALYDTRIDGWAAQPPLRANFSRHHRKIKTVADLKATLRAGPYAWPGGYPLYFILADGESASFNTVKAEFRHICASYLEGDSAWQVIGCDVNYESVMRCAISGNLIEAAYRAES